MTVGEMIARHHFKDALWCSRADAEAFAATPVGEAFVRFEKALLYAQRCDSEFEFQDRGEKAARIAWERSDKARAEFLSVLRQSAP